MTFLLLSPSAFRLLFFQRTKKHFPERSVKKYNFIFLENLLDGISTQPAPINTDVVAAESKGRFPHLLLMILTLFLRLIKY